MFYMTDAEMHRCQTNECNNNGIKLSKYTSNITEKFSRIISFIPKHE